VLDETTRPVNYSPFLTLTATAKQPDLAKEYVDTWANVAIDTARRANELHVGAALKTLSTQQTSFEDQLNKVWQAQAKESSQWNLDVLKTQLDTRVEQIAEVQGRLLKAEQQKEENSKRYDAAQKRLANEKETLDLFYSPSDDVYWLGQIQKDGGKQPAEELKNKGMLHQAVNQVYVSLSEDESEALLAMSQADAAIKALNEQLNKLENERLELQKELAEHTVLNKQLSAEETTLTQVYTGVSRIHSYLDVAQGLSSSKNKEESIPVGINRLTNDVYVEEADGLLGPKVRVVLMGLVAFLAAVTYVALRALLPLYLPSSTDGSEPPMQAS